MSSTLIQPKEEPSASGDRRLTWILVMIAALTLAAYWPLLHNGFIDYDDTDYVTLNMAVRQGLTLEGLSWSLGAFHAANWHPLTWLSHMLDVQLFDLNPVGHHATSLALHIANALLLCVLLHRLTGALVRSALVALLFAVHPLHVESVAWVAERKDVLSTLFWFLTSGAYAWYARRPGPGRYLLVTLLFALGLSSKQMLVTLPAILLLMDYWPLGRTPGATPRYGAQGSGWGRLLLEKAPLLGLSVLAALITLRAQHAGGALRQADAGAFLVQTGNALISYVTYIGRMFWPTDLALFYPYEPDAVTALKVIASAGFLALVSVLVLMQRVKRPYLAFGWFWYLVTLVPVIGFVRVGGQALADRYSYIPLTGLFVMLVWGGAELAGNWRNGKRYALGGMGVVLAALCLLSFIQVGFWQNSFTLYQHALAVVPRNWLAHNNMGILLSQNSRVAEAIGHFQESVRLNPNGSEGFRNLGNAYQMSGRPAEAIDAFRAALRANPDDVESHFRLGYAYLLGGAPELAFQQYRQLERLDPTRAGALLDSLRLNRSK
jgi:protein O-mannosyl-transferase